MMNQPRNTPWFFTVQGQSLTFSSFVHAAKGEAIRLCCYREFGAELKIVTYARLSSKLLDKYVSCFIGQGWSRSVFRARGAAPLNLGLAGLAEPDLTVHACARIGVVALGPEAFQNKQFHLVSLV